MVFETYKRPFTSAEPLPLLSTAPSTIGSQGYGASTALWRHANRERLSLGSVRSSYGEDRRPSRDFR